MIDTTTMNFHDVVRLKNGEDTRVIAVHNSWVAVETSCRKVVRLIRSELIRESDGTIIVI